MNRDFTWAELGERIRTRRQSMQMSQQALADAAELTQNAICRLESGETNPQLVTLQRIAASLGCSVRELFTGRNEDEPQISSLTARIRAIIDSKDDGALFALEGGVSSAELLMERNRGGRSQRRLVIKGQNDPLSPTTQLWLDSQVRAQSSSMVDPAINAKRKRDVPKKASEPFQIRRSIHEA